MVHGTICFEGFGNVIWVDALWIKIIESAVISSSTKLLLVAP